MEKNRDTMQKGVTFLNLLGESKILIPKIQRDYAQGRPDLKTQEIRHNFLASIHKSLTTNDGDVLLLDFVYGSTNNSLFTPLDGQQRLTTLLLLHWYFIPEEQKSLLYTTEGDSCYSRFSYETRISSKDFCNKLVANSCITLKTILDKQRNICDKDCELSDVIKNQSWFLWSWSKDPTVKAMLKMLDEIDLKFKDYDSAMRNQIWGRLVDGRIQFHLLPLEQFALTDELYVKMNARGKELSQFDIFKSTLEEQMRLNKVDEKIQNQWRESVDSKWIDIFWNKLAKPHLTDHGKLKDEIGYVNSVESGYLRFLLRMMLYHLYSEPNPIDVSQFTDQNGQLKVDDLNRILPFKYKESVDLTDQIREHAVQNNILDLMPIFNETNFFNGPLFESIINTFTNVIYEGSDGSKIEISERITNVWFEQDSQILFDVVIAEKINYDSLLQYYAVIQFAKYNNAAKIIEDEKLISEFNSWMRVIRNLTTNTNSYFYNTWDNFHHSLEAIKSISNSVYGNKEYKSIVNLLADGNYPMRGFYRQQIDEEYEKAKLMTQTDCKDRWIEIIRQAEEHRYFTGQIWFLLKWSDGDIVKFEKYYRLLSTMFCEDGLVEELILESYFKNALLCVDKWYLLNDSFMVDKTKDRDISWKRYLRGGDKTNNIKLLLDHCISDNPKDVFEWIKLFIETHKPTDWRKYFIEFPMIYDQMRNKKVSWWHWDHEKSDGEINLISKTTRSSRHKELRTYYWHLKFWNQGDWYCDSTCEVSPFTAVFKRNENTISVKFKHTENHPWCPEGDYVIYDSATENETIFKTSNYEQVEDALKLLLTW